MAQRIVNLKRKMRIEAEGKSHDERQRTAGSESTKEFIAFVVMACIGLLAVAGAISMFQWIRG